LCHMTLKLAVSRSQPPVPYGLIYFYFTHTHISWTGTS